MSIDLFHLLGRYFWLVCRRITAYQYFWMRDAKLEHPGDPNPGADAISLRRRLFAVSDLPWIVMGWGILVDEYLTSGISSGLAIKPVCAGVVWDIVAVTVFFAFWVFFLGGAQKMVVLKPVEIRWHRTGFRGTTSGIIELTVGRVKLFAAIGPVGIKAGLPCIRDGRAAAEVRSNT